MAAIDEDIDKTLSQFCQKLSQTDQCLDQIVRECFAAGAGTHQILKDEVRSMVARQQGLRGQFYQFLTPYCQSGDDFDIRKLDLSQLQEEVLRVINGMKLEDENLMRLVEGLKDFKKWGDEINERVLELMKDFDVGKEKNIITSHDRSSLDKEVGKEKISDRRLKGKKCGVLSVSDVAIEMYGFPWDLAFQIEASLQHRKLIQFESQFNEDEAQIMELDHEDSDEDADPILLQRTVLEKSWVKVKKLKRIFVELNKKIYKKPGVHLNDAQKEEKGNEDPESLRVSFLRVIRNWIFHIESILFNLIYELYHMLSDKQTAKAIFQDYKAKLENLMKKNNGKVPITVHKMIGMMENPGEFIATGLVIRTPIVYRCGNERLHKNIELDAVMHLVHRMILRLRIVLFTSCLWCAKTITADESASIEDMLEECEEEVRDIEGIVCWAKSEVEANSLRISTK